MNVLDIAKKRYSVRAYKNKPVEKEKLDKYLPVLMLHQLRQTCSPLNYWLYRTKNG